MGWKIVIDYQNMNFIHMQFSHFFYNFFQIRTSNSLQKFIINLWCRGNFITFSERSKALLAYMFFSHCGISSILGKETFMTPCHYRYIKNVFKIYFRKISFPLAHGQKSAHSSCAWLAHTTLVHIQLVFTDESKATCEY